MDEHEMIDVKIGEVIKVPLATEKPKPKQIDLRTVSANDLKSIEKQDTFLYYSIPGVRSAKVLGRDIDTSDLATSKIPRDRGFKAEQDKASQSQTVTRRSCISFECHPDLLLEDLLDDDASSDEDFDLASSVEDADEDQLLGLLLLDDDDEDFDLVEDAGEDQLLGLLCCAEMILQ